jgi:hypothetical protein
MKNLAASFPFLAAVSLLTLGLPYFSCASSAPATQRYEPTLRETVIHPASVTIRVTAYIGGERSLMAVASGVTLGIGGLVLTNNDAESVDPDISTSDPEVSDVQFEVCYESQGLDKPCAPAKIEVISESDGLALLRTNLPDQDPIRMRPDDEPLVKSKVYRAHLSQATRHLPISVEGLYVGPTEDGADVYRLMTNPKGAGGPVFDLRGRLVGIIHALATDDEGKVFAKAIPVRDILKFLVENEEILKK